VRKFQLGSPRWVTVGLACAAISGLLFAIVSGPLPPLGFALVATLIIGIIGAVGVGITAQKKIKSVLFFTIGIVAALFAIVIFAVTNSTNGDGTGSEAIPPPNPDPNQLAAFFANCEKGIATWRAGQVDYPARLSMDMGQLVAYVAAVDIRTNPLPAAQVIPGGTPESEPVAVQCLLGARLLPVGNAMEVDNREWILRKFTPTGLLNWSWSVKAVAAGDHELRLELEPVVTTQSQYVLLQGGSPPDVSTHVSQVHVNASWIQRVGQWWDDSWPIITVVAAGIGAAIIAVIKWGGEVFEAVHNAFRKRREG
jgi:hypothetical protein